MVASTHWLASAAGMAVLERGGNAFDAARRRRVRAAGRRAAPERAGRRPARGVLERRRGASRSCSARRGRRRPPRRSSVPLARARARAGHGPARRVRPGRVRRLDAAPARLRDAGGSRTCSRSRSATPRTGIRSCRAIAATIRHVEPLLRELAGVGRALPAAAASRATLPQPRARRDLRGGSSRLARRLARGRDRACARRLLPRVRRRGDRPLLARARRAPDGRRPRAAGARRSRRPRRVDYRGLTVCKTGAVGPGACRACSSSRCSTGFDLAAMGPAPSSSTPSSSARSSRSPTARRSTATRFVDVPLDAPALGGVQRRAARAGRRRRASRELRPGLGRLPPLVRRRRACRCGAGEPTRGDTVHVDVADRFGNIVSATPSGGWLQSSPVIPALGLPLGTRAQMFWLDDGLAVVARAAASGRGRRSRRRSRSRGGEPYLAFGTPGGDQQDQWTLQCFLAHVDLGLDLQEAIDAPEFHTDHFIELVLSRAARAALADRVEERFGDDVVAGLRRARPRRRRWRRRGRSAA